MLIFFAVAFGAELYNRSFRMCFLVGVSVLSDSLDLVHFVELLGLLKHIIVFALDILWLPTLWTV